jgi:hypothetical protein
VIYLFFEGLSAGGKGRKKAARRERALEIAE